MKPYKKSIYTISFGFLIGAALLLMYTHTAQTAYQADLQWLQNMSVQLANPVNRDSKGIMRHITYGIKKKLEQRPELAIMPFERQNNQNAPTINDMLAPTIETTLFLRAMEAGHFPTIKAIMEAGVSPLIEFDLLHENRQNRLKAPYLQALFAFATIPTSQCDTYVDNFIRVIEYAHSIKQQLMQARDTITKIQELDRDPKNIIFDMLSGGKEEQKRLERITGFLHKNPYNKKTLLDQRVEILAQHTSIKEHSHKQESARHRLQTYLLQHRVRLSQQKHLHNSTMKDILHNLVLKLLAGCGLVGGAIVMVSSRHFQPDNQRLFLATGAINLLGSYLFCSTEFEAIRYQDVVINMIKERYLAWKQGITDMWGQKKEEGLVDEVGGLE